MQCLGVATHLKKTSQRLGVARGIYIKKMRRLGVATKKTSRRSGVARGK
jgi:hypothetical protein